MLTSLRGRGGGEAWMRQCMHVCTLQCMYIAEAPSTVPGKEPILSKGWRWMLTCALITSWKKKGYKGQATEKPSHGRHFFPYELMYAYKQKWHRLWRNILSLCDWSEPTGFYCDLNFSMLVDFKMANDSPTRDMIKISIQSMFALPCALPCFSSLAKRRWH